MGLDLTDVTEVKAEEKKDDPADAAAGMLQIYLPQFNNRVDQMSKKAVQKLVKSLMAYTVEDMPGNLVGKEEREAFIIGVRLLEAKSILYLAAIRDKLNEIEGNESNGMETNNSGQHDEGTTNGRQGTETDASSVFSSEQVTEGTDRIEAGTDTQV